MHTRFVRYQLVAFALLTVIGVTYASIVYVDLPRLVGLGRFEVSMDLARTAGIYENAIVTYRGKQVGKVEEVGLKPGGVRLVMSIDESSEIPTDLTAQVRSTSAIGEQYVNLEPRSSGGPTLAAGAVIPQSRTELPTDTATLLATVNEFVATIPQDKLNTVLDESYAAFRNTGGDLQRLVDSAGALTRSASENLEPTVALFQDLQPVLATQQRSRAQIATLTQNLADFTDRTRASDGDIRGVIDSGPELADELTRLVNDLEPTLPLLLSNLTDIGQVTTAYLPHIRQTLVVVPLAARDVAQITFGYSSPIKEFATLNFKLSVNDPPPCVVGFDPDRKDAGDLTPYPSSANNYCKDPSKAIGVRMGKNYPCPPGSPGFGSRSITAAGCGLNFRSPAAAAAQQEKNLAIGLCAQVHMPMRQGDPFTEPGENEACYTGDSIPPSQANGSFPVDDAVPPTPEGYGTPPAGSPFSADTPATPNPAGASATAGAVPAPSANAQYLPGSGTAIGSDGRPFVLGNVVAPTVAGPSGLGGFLVTPLQPASA